LSVIDSKFNSGVDFCITDA